jgi:hypothetical protein
MFSAKVIKNFGTASMAKHLPFAMAQTLTATAKDGQKAVTGGLGGKFTLRGNWYMPSNKFGIRVQPAKKTSLRASFGTMADWLEKFETGKDKTPRGEHLAIPTANVRRTKRQIIQRSQRPAALRGKRTFVAQTKSGLVLFQRKFKGKRSQLVPLYNLERSARITRNSPVIEPGVKAVKANLGANFRKSMEQAMKSAK